MEVGPVEAGAASQVPISWQTIDSWANRTAQRPTPWESRTLRRLSCEYLAELVSAEDPQRAAPYIAVGQAVDQQAMERQLRAVLG